MKVETYKIKDWEDSEQGLLLAENEQWILVKHIPVDYVIDGYRLYHKGFVEERSSTVQDAQIEKVLRLKNVEDAPPANFSFADTLGLLDWVESNYGIFEFQDDDESELFYGKKNRIENNALIIDMIHSDGSVEVDYDYEFNLDEIRVITFESDYHTSIQLLWRDQLNKA
ncbi:hypothetical protein POV27_07670 [Aureisphaera galaxeae]|uniref:hypothetical protein n=1 Tax=Aureisphaera galaxeae TaxID=1538023 RepID=UPI002350EA1E|nr:hypothetical protein [Aureisphaera galaxeae]MDC8003926.1 hypothetical protein [Aureisphaera galaxeae]